jgi:hypothetical protein
MLHRSRTAWLEDAAPALYSTRAAQANAGSGGLRLTGC